MTHARRHASLGLRNRPPPCTSGSACRDREPRCHCTRAAPCLQHAVQCAHVLGQYVHDVPRHAGEDEQRRLDQPGLACKGGAVFALQRAVSEASRHMGRHAAAEQQAEAHRLVGQQAGGGPGWRDAPGLPPTWASSNLRISEPRCTAPPGCKFPPSLGCLNPRKRAYQTAHTGI